MIIEILATYRLTRLIIHDRVLARPRDAVFLWALRPKAGKAAHPKVIELLTCWWCVSFYAAGIVVVLRRNRYGRTLLRAFALSAATGILAERRSPPA